MQSDFAGIPVAQGDRAFVIAAAVAKVEGAFATATFSSGDFDTAHDPLTVATLHKRGRDGAREGIAAVANARRRAGNLMDIVFQIVFRLQSGRHRADTIRRPSGFGAVACLDAGAIDHYRPKHLIAAIEPLIGDRASEGNAVAVHGQVLGMRDADRTGIKIRCTDINGDLTGQFAAVLADAACSEVNRAGIGEGALGDRPSYRGASRDGGRRRHPVGGFVFDLFDHATCIRRCLACRDLGIIAFDGVLLAGRHEKKHQCGEGCEFQNVLFHTSSSFFLVNILKSNIRTLGGHRMCSWVTSFQIAFVIGIWRIDVVGE